MDHINNSFNKNNENVQNTKEDIPNTNISFLNITKNSLMDINNNYNGNEFNFSSINNTSINKNLYFNNDYMNNDNSSLNNVNYNCNFLFNLNNPNINDFQLFKTNNNMCLKNNTHKKTIGLENENQCNKNIKEVNEIQEKDSFNNKDNEFNEENSKITEIIIDKNLKNEAFIENSNRFLENKFELHQYDYGNNNNNNNNNNKNEFFKEEKHIILKENNDNFECNIDDKIIKHFYKIQNIKRGNFYYANIKNDPEISGLYDEFIKAKQISKLKNDLNENYVVNNNDNFDLEPNRLKDYDIFDYYECKEFINFLEDIMSHISLRNNPNSVNKKNKQKNLSKKEIKTNIFNNRCMKENNEYNTGSNVNFLSTNENTKSSLKNKQKEEILKSLSKIITRLKNNHSLKIDLNEKEREYVLKKILFNNYMEGVILNNEKKN